uniref:Putative ovule protein n=1 Tax=Solanum chacoense TaxID=4108 RepID=A0A0V0HIT5_SOLCH
MTSSQADCFSRDSSEEENCLSINAVPSLRYQAIFETSIEVLEQGSKRRKLWFSSQSLSFAKNFVLPDF